MSVFENIAFPLQMDEPLSNLDAALRMEMRSVLTQLHKRLGSTMVYVTHDQLEAMTMADRIVVLNAGKVEQVGKPMELYHRPANLFVAGFIGSPPMNFIAAKVVGIDGGEVLLDAPGVGRLALPGDVSGFVVGGDATIGVRPEAITTAAPAEPALAMSVVPRSIERLGLHTIVHAEQDGRVLTCLFNGDPSIGADAPLGVHVPMAQIHLFDAAGMARGRRD